MGVFQQILHRAQAVAPTLRAAANAVVEQLYGTGDQSGVAAPQEERRQPVYVSQMNWLDTSDSDVATIPPRSGGSLSAAGSRSARTGRRSR